MRVWNIFVMMGVMLLTLLIAGCEGSAEQRIDSSAYLKTMDVKGDSKSCAVVLRAQQGMTFTMDVTSEGDWAHFNNGSTQLNDTMTASDRVVYIYFGKNATGEARRAEVRVQFSDGVVVECSFTQHSYDSSLAFERQWAELPLCKVQNNYIYNTHYGALGAKSDARNYTYCFDPSVRASLWVAYPLHSSYMNSRVTHPFATK